MVHTHYKDDVNKDCDIRITNIPIKHVRINKFFGLNIYDRLNYNGNVITHTKWLSRIIIIEGLISKLSHIIPTKSVRQLY